MKRFIFTLVALVGILSFTDNAYAMHISEGILPMKWAGLWYAVAIPFLIYALGRIPKKTETIPHFKPLLGLVGALVFVISCMPVPVLTAGTCSHPAGTGISAILIGPFMSVLVTSIALLLQALFLAHGGITTWGADIVSMGVAGSFAAFLIFKLLRKIKAPLFVCGFAAGLFADWATYTMTSFELALALHGTESFSTLFKTILIAFVPTQLPLGIFEGFITGGMIVFVANRRPDILQALGVLKKSATSCKTVAKSILVIIAFSAICSAATPVSAEEDGPWSGVDVSVIEKIAAEHGRKAWTPFINTDQGDLLLFVFLIAGSIGGFIAGYYWRELFTKKEKLK